MAIIATSEATSFAPIEAGNYPARCYSMIHLGTLLEMYMGEEKLINKIRISWELPTELKVFKEEKGEQPLSISKEFTLSMHEKANLRKFLAGWRGKDFTEEEALSFDVTNLLGKECMLSIIHKTSKTGRVYAEISSCSTVPKGIKVDPQINPTFELGYDNFDNDKFNSLPAWLSDKMKTSIEYKNIFNPETKLEETHNEQSSEEIADNLPF